MNPPAAVHGATALKPVPAPAAPRTRPDLPPWTLARLLGSLVEISGAGALGVLSSAVALVAEAHQSDRIGLTAWVGTIRSLFFPPDAVEAGVDLDRLVLLRLENLSDQIRAATSLVHSGAFGLVVVDLVDSLAVGSPRFSVGAFSSSRRSAPVPPLSRLSCLARKHSSALVLLTEKSAGAPSLDPRVVQRYDAGRRGSELVITVVKDKTRSAGARTASSPRRGGGRKRNAGGLFALRPGARFERRCREPAGMC